MSRAEQAEQVESAVRRYVEWLPSIKSIQLKLVILFGSYARGDFRMDSDVDIVVADGLPDDAVDCYVLLTNVPLDHEPVDIEPHPYSPEEFIASANANNQKPVDALIEGQVLYIDDQYREELLKAL